MCADDKKCNAREALLDAAAKLFGEREYEAVSTREIAETARVNLGAIQYHFGSKANLFAQTIKHMMQGSTCERIGFDADEKVNTKGEAAAALCHFIRLFLGYLVRPKAAPPCRLLFREILTGTSQDKELFEVLVSSGVNDFMQPVVSTISNLVRPFYRAASIPELQAVATSILGQCTYYVTHQAFLERMLSKSFSEPATVDQIAEQISRFSLAAIGCECELLEQTILTEFSPEIKKVAAG